MEGLPTALYTRGGEINFQIQKQIFHFLGTSWVQFLPKFCLLGLVQVKTSLGQGTETIMAKMQSITGCLGDM